MLNKRCGMLDNTSHSVWACLLAVSGVFEYPGTIATAKIQGDTVIRLRMPDTMKKKPKDMMPVLHVTSDAAGNLRVPLFSNFAPATLYVFLGRVAHLTTIQLLNYEAINALQAFLHKGSERGFHLKNLSVIVPLLYEARFRKLLGVRPEDHYLVDIGQASYLALKSNLRL